MSKLKDPVELFNEFNIELEYDAGIYKNRNVRFLEDIGLFQVGDDNFDRWANSVELEFDLFLPKGQRQFIRWASE